MLYSYPRVSNCHVYILFVLVYSYFIFFYSSRYRCETCDDFDLCSTCKARVTHNQAHNFRFINNEQSFPPQYTQQQKMDVPEANSSSTSCQSFNPSQTIFICDFCDSDIVGIRHTCGACPGINIEKKFYPINCLTDHYLFFFICFYVD